MNPKKLRRLRRELEKLRRQSKGGIAASKLENLAKALGRVQDSNKNWKSTLLPETRPITIHRHGKPLLPLTAGNILDSLELDLQILEERYGDEE